MKYIGPLFRGDILQCRKYTAISLSPLLRERISRLEKTVDLRYVSPELLEGLPEHCQVED